MKLIHTTIFVLLTSFTFGTTSFAQTPAPTCNAAAQEKKLAGATKNSFLKKCEREAIAKCKVAAAERKLAGTAKNTSIRKCVKKSIVG